MRIYLIAMPGTGKSRTGRSLSAKLNMEFVDLDSYITLNYGPIPLIFETNGEEGFRRIESKCLEELRMKDNIVVACGGGIIKNAQNRELMRPGVIFYLDASIDLIKEHLEQSKTERPVLKEKTVEEIYEERHQSYLRFADYIVNYTDSSSATDKICEFVSNITKKKVLVVNGPNLNLLGKRDKDHYGTKTLEDINKMISSDISFEFDFYQSNVEGYIVDKLQEYEHYDAIIINPAAYTHTSVAIHDCLEVVNIPKVEVHLSDVDNREDFRKVNMVRDVTDICFSKEHENSYLQAVDYLKTKLNVL